MSIEINGINKYFGRTKVLNDISLDIASGEMDIFTTLAPHCLKRLLSALVENLGPSIVITVPFLWFANLSFSLFLLF